MGDPVGLRRYREPRGRVLSPGAHHRSCRARDGAGRSDARAQVVNKWLSLFPDSTPTRTENRCSMKLQLFRRGTHVASNGERLTFSDADLEASARAYDPKLHEAPIVVGHPELDKPAYGWIGKLAYNKGEGAMDGDGAQVDPAFAELVKN